MKTASLAISSGGSLSYSSLSTNSGQQWHASPEERILQCNGWHSIIKKAIVLNEACSKKANL